MRYDDAELDCPMCSRGVEAEDLCGCDHETGPMCPRCHAVYHGRWAA